MSARPTPASLLSAVATAWRHMRADGGSVEWSERHVADLIRYPQLATDAADRCAIEVAKELGLMK